MNWLASFWRRTTNGGHGSGNGQILEFHPKMALWIERPSVYKSSALWSVYFNQRWCLTRHWSGNSAVAHTSLYESSSQLKEIIMISQNIPHVFSVLLTSVFFSVILSLITRVDAPQEICTLVMSKFVNWLDFFFVLWTVRNPRKRQKYFTYRWNNNAFGSSFNIIFEKCFCILCVCHLCWESLVL